jgi:hypothetical protein
MESLRQEVRRLTQSSAPPEAKSPAVATAATTPSKPVVAEPAAAREPSQAKKEPAPQKSGPAPAKMEPVPAKKEAAPPAKDAAKATDARAKGPAAAPAAETKVASAAPTQLRREFAAQEWARRIQLVEGQHGKLSFSKAAALLFEPLTDEQLLALVEKERALKDLPYNSALALGINAAGRLVAWKTWGENTRELAVDSAIERCTRSAQARCAVVVVNGDFREAGFLEWARNASERSIVMLRADLLRLRGGR